MIAAASSAHADLIHACADAGLPTFCEKPITIDLASTAAVVEHVHATGIQLQMGFQRRFDAGFSAARDLVADGSLGTLYVVRMAGHDPAPPHEDYIPASGGIFRDFSVHDFDALRFVTGQETVEVYADGAVLNFPQFARYGDVDTGVVALRLSGGASGSSRSRGTTRSATTSGWSSSGRGTASRSGGTTVSRSGRSSRVPRRRRPTRTRTSSSGSPRPIVRRCTPSWRWRKGGARVPCTAEDALEAMRVAVACDRSREEHRPVRLEEVA